jgi:transglutaminase-like putative cysteine protease
MSRSRLTLVFVALGAALGDAGGSAAEQPAPISAGDLGARTVSYVYQAHATAPPGTKVLELWMPLPREEDQTLLALSLSGTAPATVVSQRGSGDRVAYLRVTDPTEPVTLTQTATVARREVRAEPSMSHAAVADVDRAVYAAQLDVGPAIQVNDEIRAIAARETAGKDTVVARARALYDWVFTHMEYDKSVPGWGLGDIPYCLKVGKGNCTDFHTLFIALSRASGIPARWNMGFPLAYGDGHSPGAEAIPVQGYHCWAEFYAPGAGWVPVDISEARKHLELRDYFFGHLSGNRILFTRLRGQPLEPGNGDPRNYFIYPVARADGVELPDVTWTFSYRDQAAVAAR